MRPEIEKSETQNRRLEPACLGKSRKPRGLPGTGRGVTRQDTVGPVFGRFWKRTLPCSKDESGRLAGHPDTLLTLRSIECTKQWMSLQQLANQK